MKAKRVLVTGYSTPQLARHVEYTIEMGASVLHAGYHTLYPANPPPDYRFVSIAEDATPDMRFLRRGGQAYQELVVRESQCLGALIADFRPHLCHAAGMDMTFELSVVAGAHPLLVSVFGYVNHWVYQKAELKEKDQPLAKADALLIDAPAIVEAARTLFPATVRVEEFAIGFNGHYFRPADATTRANWRRVLNLPPQSLAILSPRGWARDYNHEYVVAAFAKALPSLPPPAYLLFVSMGRSADSSKALAYFEEVRQEAERLGVIDHIRWLPAFPREAMPTLYNAADLVISYVSPDTFGYTILEAMACERPVLAPDLPVYPGSVIADHCRLVPPKDAAALAEAILDIVRNPPSAEALSAGRQAVLARYDKAVVMGQLAAIYDELLP